MGCEFSITDSFEFLGQGPEQICSFSDVTYLPDQKFHPQLEKVKALCQNKKFKEAHEIGDKFFSKHAILQAIQIYQHIIQCDPNYGMQQLQGLGNVELAMSYYQEHVWKFYNSLGQKSIYDALSLCYMILSYSKNEFINPLSRGQVWYKKMIQKESRNIGLLIGCGNILCNLEDTFQGLEYYEQATEVYGAFTNIHVIKAVTYRFKKSDRQKSTELSNKVLEMTKDNMYAELILATHIEPISERVLKLSQLHQKYPTYNRILTQQGADYTDLDKNIIRSLECYEKSIKANPMFHKGYNNKASCIKDNGDYDKSLEYFFKSIEINRHFSYSYEYGILVLMEKMGMNDQKLKEQLQKHPKVIRDWFWMKMAEACEVRKPDQTQRIISYYQKAIESNPKCYLAYWQLGKFYRSMQMNQKAIENYKKSFEVNPQFFHAYQNLAMLNSALGYGEQAIKMYEKTIEINPRHSLAYHNLGDIYLERKDYEKAELYFENAVKFSPKNSLFLLNCGVCYFKQNKYKQAHENFLNSKQYLDRTKNYYGNQTVQQIQKTLKNTDIDNQKKWSILVKSVSINEDQKDRLQKMEKEFKQKLKNHQKINAEIKMPLERIMNPDLLQITKQIYECKFGIVGLAKTFKYIMKLYCELDEDYFHIVPLFIVQFFLRSVYEFKVDPHTVENDCQKYMKEIAGMVAEKQKEANESSADANKENQQASVNLKNIKIQLTQCKPLNKQINLFKEAAYFDTYQDLYAEIDKANNAAKPFYNDFALLVEQVRTKAKGLPGGISMKIPSKSQDQFKVIMRIMEKMFKKEIDPERVRKTIFNIYTRIVNSEYDQNKISQQIIDAWNYQITKMLKERKEKKIQTQCFLSDLIRAKCVFNNVEDLAQAVKVADSYCKANGYQIVELDNRLAKPQTKDVVLKILIGEAVCEFQLAIPQSAKLFKLDHCVYEIIRSPLGCVFGSYLFISKQVKYPLAKNCEDMYNEFSKSKDMMDKINKMYPQYVRNALTKQWTILGKRSS